VKYNVTHQDALAIRLWAWSNQRFSLFEAPLYIVFYFTVVITARKFGFQTDQHVLLFDLFGCIAFWSFFLCLRIFDEHMDYRDDCITRPDYVLQQGLITLRHLKVVAAIAVTLQLGVSLYVDNGIGKATLVWLSMITWNLLAANNFFCGTWFNRHLVHHALVHYLSLPIATFWLALLANPQTLIDKNIVVLAVFSYLCALLYELLRKTLPKSKERPRHDSYSKIFGIEVASLIIWILLTTSLVVTGYFIKLVNQSISSNDLIVLLGIFACASATLLCFCFKPTTSLFKFNKSTIATAIVAMCGQIIFSLVTI
jgi:hypothetical protein